MPYRFIRNGSKPIDQKCGETQLVSCFAYCTDYNKRRLRKFIDSKRKFIAFKFKEYTVMVMRV